MTSKYGASKGTTGYKASTVSGGTKPKSYTGYKNNEDSRKGTSRKLTPSKSGNKNFNPIIIICVIVVILIGFLILYFTKDSKPYIYIALGDSVSSGFGIDEESQYYTFQLFHKLQTDGYVKEHYNLAQNGFTTSDLLEMLNNQTKKELKKFKKARVVSVNIGGNNVLLPFIDYVSNTQLAAGLSSIKVGGEEVVAGSLDLFNEISSGVRSVVSENDQSSFDAKGAWEGIKRIGSGFGSLFTGAKDVIVGAPTVYSVLDGNISDELMVAFDSGLQTFTSEFQEIIIWIENNAPNATIIVNTIFNPIPEEILLLSIPLSEWASIYLEAMNSMIIEASEQKGFLVTDVHAHMSNRLNLMSFNLNPLRDSISLDMVHPNVEGHRLIAELNYLEFIKGK
ncbi:MAG: SGNH/GDSL hydrolase family protein [Candidatus Cloacimonetes bacterium]|nr:SGNH/GDSL hydrolase family protein [Candidatus Cloacimonadota bacterium]